MVYNSLPMPLGTYLKAIRMRSKPPKRKRRAPTLARLKKALDAVFSQFIRQRDGGRCVTCGATGRWQDFQCGHYHKRRFLGTRWDERNCNSQCGTCNGPRRGAENEHAAYIARTYGAGVLDELIAAKKASLKLYRTDYEEKIASYKERLKTLEVMGSF